MAAKRHPYYKYPVVVYKDNPPAAGTDGRRARYRIETVEGDNFFLPNFRQVMKFLQYHGCYGVREDEMSTLRQARPGEGRASAREQ
jgi:hypothetical protein